MLRIRTSLNGWEGGPGLSTSYFFTATEDVATAQACTERVRTFWGAVCGATMNTSISAQTQAQVDVVNEATGDMTNALIVDPGAPIIGGQGAAGLSAIGVSVLITWNTGVFEGGRRIRGRTFVSPLVPAIAATNGKLQAGTVTSLTNAGVALMGTIDQDPILVVWRRPREAGSGKNGDLPARAGRTANVTSVVVPSKLTFLRSRRD